MGNYRRSGGFTPYTAILNVTGQPSIALPLFQGPDGLPTAVQLIGPPAREDLLLALATALEQALPWADRRPALNP
jgi:amidase